MGFRVRLDLSQLLKPFLLERRHPCLHVFGGTTLILRRFLMGGMQAGCLRSQGYLCLDLSSKRLGNRIIFKANIINQATPPLAESNPETTVNIRGVM